MAEKLAAFSVVVRTGLGSRPRDACAEVTLISCKLRRVGVTEAAGKLQRLNLINYVRGHIIVLDRPGLERHVCECYGVVKRETDRLLPHQIAV